MKDNNFCIMHIEKYKTLSAMTKSYNHNYRRLMVGAINPENLYNSFKNVQLDRIHLDIELIDTYDGRDYASVWRNRFEHMDFYKNNTLRKDAVKGLEIMLTMSHDISDNVNINEWAEANVEWLQKTFGVKNVESAMLHLDESTPHIHSFVLPILDGRFCAKEILGNAAKMSQTQDSYSKAMEPFGLERGIKNSHAQHESIKYLHGEINAIAEKATKLTKITNNSLGLKESVQEYASRLTPIMEETLVKLHAVEKKTNVLDRYKSKH